MSQPITRRSMLLGTGASVALPMLAPATGFGAKLAAPKRLIFLNFGYGTSKAWYPTTSGMNFKPTEALGPLSRHRKMYSVLGNLTNVASSGTGAHWGSTTFLTSADTQRTPGRAFHNGISCDQVAAMHLGKNTRFASMALTASPENTAGHGPGASLSWDAQGNPVQGIDDQVALFNRMFGGGNKSLAQQQLQIDENRSVMDVVRRDASAVQRKVGADDKQKLEEYFTLIRSIEGRLKRDEAWLKKPKPKSPIAAPKSIVKGSAGVELMFDLMTAAFQTDSTRVIS